MDAFPDERARRIARRARGRGEHVPADGDLANWLREPGSDGAPGVGRYLAAIWQERVDLQEAFPGIALDPAQRDAFLEWAHHFAAAEAGAPARLIPPIPTRADDQHMTLLRPGLVVVGYLRAVLGLGGSARRLAHLARLAGEEVAEVAYDHTTSPLDHPWSNAADARDLDVVALCVNGAQTPRLVRALGPRALQGRHRIGLWFWELEQFPPDQAEGFELVDEVWVTSAFVRDAIAAAAPSHVGIHVIPLGTEVAVDDHGRGDDVDRAQLGLPDATLLLGTTFDHASRAARKNPLGLIDAFRRAFPVIEPSGPVLVIKTLNGHLHTADAAAVRAAAHDAGADVLVIDRQYTFREQRAFLRELDVLVSLHRSEGYGNSLLEAMGHGHPVIATGYSGNLAFMAKANSWLVPCTLEPVPEGTGIYASDARWAAPDLDEAARMMREVVSGIDTSAVRDRAERGRLDVMPVLDGSAGAAFVRGRLAAIRERRARR